MIEKDVDPALHAQVVVEGVAVEIAELRGVPFQGKATEWSGYVGFHQASPSEYDETLYLLDEQDHIPIVYFFSYRYNLPISVCSIKVWVKISKLGLILSFILWRGLNL